MTRRPDGSAGPPLSAMSPRSTAASSASTSSWDRMFSTMGSRPASLDHEFGEIHAAHLLELQFLANLFQQLLLQLQPAVLLAERFHRRLGERADDQVGDARLVFLDLLRVLGAREP